jgi:hypothetical protein
MVAVQNGYSRWLTTWSYQAHIIGPRAGARYPLSHQKPRFRRGVAEPTARAGVRLVTFTRTALVASKILFFSLDIFSRRYFAVLPQFELSSPSPIVWSRWYRHVNTIATQQCMTSPCITPQQLRHPTGSLLQLEIGAMFCVR